MKPVFISALGRLGATKLADAVAIADFFGLAAQRLVKVIIRATITKFVNRTAEDVSLDTANADFHAADFA
jgi:hypothetical protein